MKVDTAKEILDYKISVRIQTNTTYEDLYIADQEHSQTGSLANRRFYYFASFLFFVLM